MVSHVLVCCTGGFNAGLLECGGSHSYMAMHAAQQWLSYFSGASPFVQASLFVQA